MPDRWSLLGEKEITTEAKRIATVLGVMLMGGPHSFLNSVFHSDTLTATVARGSIVVGNATPLWAELTIGAVGTYLYSDGTDASYKAIAIGDITDLAYAVPSLTLTTANAEGAASSVIRSDASILVFDATNPTTIQCDASAGVGAAGVAARRDHTHGIVCAAPGANLAVATTNTEGSATSFSRSDHSHAITSSSNPGAAAAILASDASGLLRLIGFGVGASPVAGAVIVAGGTWVGLGAGVGRLSFDATPAPDQVVFTSADLNIATTAHGIIHVDGVAAGQFLRADGTRYVPDTLDVADLTDLAYAAPGLTLTTANAEGVASTVMRTDASVLVFDATVPDVIECDDSAATGAASVAARRDHTHGIVCAAPGTNLAVATTNAEGAAPSFARSDHSHAITSSSNPGAAASILASDASGYLQLTGLGIGAASGAANRITIVDGGTIGQAAGPLLTFDDTNNELEITGCNLIVGAAASPTRLLHLAGNAETVWDWTGLAVDSRRWRFANTAGTAYFGAINDAMNSEAIVLSMTRAGLIGAGLVGPATNFHVYENNADTVPALLIEQDSTGDAALEFLLTGGQAYTVGIDNSDADKFCISSGATLGATDLLHLFVDGTTVTLRLDPGNAYADDKFMIGSATISVTATGNDNLAIYTTGSGDILLDPNGLVYIGDTSGYSNNANMALGLTIDQGANDDEITAWKSSDVAHGMTDQTETSVFGFVKKAEPGSGGLAIYGAKDADENAGRALELVGFLGEAADTTKSTAGFGIIYARSYVKSGTNVATPGADANLLTICSGAAARLILDQEGEIHTDAIVGVGDDWDDWDDLALAADLSRLPKAKYDEMLAYHAEDFERAGLVTLSVDEYGQRHAFIRHKAMLMFSMNCFREVHQRMQRYEGALIGLGVNLQSLEGAAR